MKSTALCPAAGEELAYPRYAPLKVATVLEPIPVYVLWSRGKHLRRGQRWVDPRGVPLQVCSPVGQIGGWGYCRFGLE